MRKKTQKIVWISLAIVLVLGIFFLVGGSKFPLAISGFQALSLGQQQFNSNDPAVGGQAWLLTVSQNGAGQSASGTFTASDPSTNANSNQFTISTAITQNYVTYNINNQNMPVTKVQYSLQNFGVLSAFNSLYGCDPTIFNTAVRYGPLGINVACIGAKTDGYTGSVSNANVNFQSTISVQGSGGSDSCSISNTGQTSCISSNGNVQASWAGSLVSGQAPPQPTDQDIMALYNTATGGWTITKGNYYTNWNNANNGLNNCIINTQDPVTCVNNVNSLENQLLSGTQFTSSGGTSATASGGQSNGQITMPLSTQVQFPVISMRIRASLIGINIPVGKPQITSCTSQKFQTGSSGIISISVRNAGNGAGSFNIAGTCTNGFSPQGNSLTISQLPPGNSQTVYLPISSNAVNDISGSCKITANDINNPNNQDTCNVGVSSSAIAICNQGDKRISGSNIQQCQSNVWVTIQTCSSGQIASYVNSVPQCVNNQGPAIPSGNPGQCTWYDIPCQIKNLFSGVSSFFDYLKYALVFIGGLVGIFFANDLLSFFKRLNKPIRIGSAIVIGVIIAVLLYQFIYSFWFWLSLILLIVYLFAASYIRSFLPRGRR